MWFKLRYEIMILLLSGCICTIHAQADSDSLLFKASALSSYVTDKALLETRILELIKLAEADRGLGKSLETFEKIHLALSLEKQLPGPTITAFKLYNYAGELISTVNPEYAIGFLRKAIGMSELIPDSLMWTVFSACSNMAGDFQELGKYDSAFANFHRAIVIARKVSPTTEASAYNNLGVFFLSQMQYDSARHYFSKALVQCKPLEEEVGLYCAIRDNIAQLDIVDGKYKRALEIFTFNDSVYTSAVRYYHKYLPNKIRQLSMFGRLNIPQEDEIGQVREFISKNYLHLKTHEILDFYSYATDHFMGIHDLDQLRIYHQAHKQLNDSVTTITREQMNVISNSLMVMQQANFQNALTAQQLLTEKTEWQLKSSRRMLMLSILGGAVILSLMVLYFRKRRQELYAQNLVAEAELRQKEMEARLIEQELALKKKDLTNLVLHNTHVHDANRKVIGRLQDVLHRKDAPSGQDIKSLLIELQSQDQMSEKALGLQAHIDTVNEAFYEMLKARFPRLTKSESELCGYLRINLSNKDISILKSIEVNSVKISKNRLRKKLALPAEADLYRFLQEL